MNDNTTEQREIAWGLELGSSAVRLVRIDRDGGGYRVSHHARVELDNRWRDEGDLAEGVRRLDVDTPSEAVTACVADECVLYRTLSLPAADGEALAKMVAGQVEVLLPSQGDRFVTAWRSEDQGDRPGHLRVLLCAIRRDALAARTRAAGRLGRPPRAVVPSALAAATAWSHLTGEGRPVVLLDVGAQCTSLAVVAAGSVIQCAVIDDGGDRWSERIADALDISPAEADSRKCAYAVGDRSADDAPLGRCVSEALADWSMQLRDAWAACREAIEIDLSGARCILLGRSARMPGLDKAVAATLGMEVQTCGPWARLSMSGDMGGDEWAPAIGAALCQLQPDATVVNLTVEPQSGSARATGSRWRWVAAAAWLLAALLGGYAVDRHQAAATSESLAAVGEQVDADGLDRRAALGRYLRQARPPALEVLDRLSDELPAGAMLTHLQYNRNGEALLRGTVANDQEYLTALKNLARLGKAEPQRGATDPKSKKFRFEIRLTLDRAMPPPKPKPKSKPEPEPEPEAEAKTKSKPESESEAKTKSKPESESESESESKPPKKPSTTNKVEAEAQKATTEPAAPSAGGES